MSTSVRLVMVITGLAVAAPAHAQGLPAILTRMSEYLRGYESQLSSLIGDESYVQHEYYRDVRQNLRPNKTRRITSEIAFLRLPGNGYWYGFREVKSVDGKPVPPASYRMADFMSSGHLEAQQAVIMSASAEWNLGSFRNINMPTVPLEVLQAARTGLATFEDDGTETIAGIKTRRVRFRETGTSTLIRHSRSEWVHTSGRAWIEPGSGRLLRAEIDCGDPRDTHDPKSDRADDFFVRVDYRHDAKLGMLVPFEMTEDFPTAYLRGDGRARYSNFRRFQTSARIIPQ